MIRTHVEQLYKPGVLRARGRFLDEAHAPLANPTIDPAVFELFLIRWCALGVQMTEPVEGWIRRAGERCEEIGLRDLGRALKIHARHEAGHQLMFLEDARKLAQRWNARHSKQIDVEALVKTPPTPGINAYIKLHEDVIASDAPFSQLAVEYEIERFSLGFGPDVIAQAKTLLGSSVTEGLSFLMEHVEIDVGHTQFNEAELEKLLEMNPAYSASLIQAGSGALDAYRVFLVECLNGAREDRKHFVSSSQQDQQLAW